MLTFKRALTIIVILIALTVAWHFIHQSSLDAINEVTRSNSALLSLMNYFVWWFIGATSFKVALLDEVHRMAIEQIKNKLGSN